MENKKHKNKALIAFIIIGILTVTLFFVLSLTDAGAWISDLIRSDSEKTEKTAVIIKGDGIDTESGYDLPIDIKAVPMSDIKGDINHVSSTIREQFMHFEPTDSTSPGYVLTDFNSEKEAIDYIGYEKLAVHSVSTEEKTVKAEVTGKSGGMIELIDLSTYYTDGDIRIEQKSKIFTEYYDLDGYKESVRTMEALDFGERTYKTENGTVCRIIRSSKMASGYLVADGYIVGDGDILYSIHLSYKEDDSDKASEIIHEWANTFN